MDVNHFRHTRNGNDFTFRYVVRETWTRCEGSFFKLVPQGKKQKNKPTFGQSLQPGPRCGTGMNAVRVREHRRQMIREVSGWTHERCDMVNVRRLKTSQAQLQEPTDTCRTLRNVLPKEYPAVTDQQLTRESGMT